MKLRKIITTLIGVLAAVLLCCGVLTACGGGGTTFSGVEVIYSLEGGTYRNATRDVRRYYQITEGGSTLITPPDRGVDDEGVTLQGYEVEGWYRVRTEDANGNVTYSEKWDFDRDKLNYGDEPLTLYCKWKVKVNHSYEIKYIDESGAEQHISDIYVSAGDPFSDKNDRADSLTGYTAERKLNSETNQYEIVYYQKDSAGNLTDWDNSFTHPGGETDVSIPVYVKLIKGDFVYVATKDDFLNASKRNNGVWLCNDIDLGGEEINGFKDGSGTFKDKAFYGNHHTVKNFKLTYDAGSLLNTLSYPALEDRSLCISLFGVLIDSTVKEATFEGVTVEINEFMTTTRALFVAPIAILVQGKSEVSDVTYKGTFAVSSGDLALTDITPERTFVVTNRPVWQEDVTTAGCTVDVTETEIPE